jgi:hypothetical protein
MSQALHKAPGAADQCFPKIERSGAAHVPDRIGFAEVFGRKSTGHLNDIRKCPLGPVEKPDAEEKYQKG